MMLEELKYVLLNLHNKNLVSGFSQFTIKDSAIRIIYCDIIVEGYEDKVLVYYDNDTTIMGVYKRLQYLNKENTLRIFENVSIAMEYLHYLVKTAEDIRFELFHYFLFRLDEIKFKYNELDFGVSRNFSFEELIVNCTLSCIELNGNKLQYTLHIMFFNDNTCKLSFIPQEPLWNEGKVCPETQIDRILHYIKTLNAYNYKDIPLNET